jgi:hypothetical protein
MPTLTFQALAVITLAVLPGALAVWGYESNLDRRIESEVPDRFLRYVAVSAFFQILILPLSYAYYRSLSGQVKGIVSTLPALVALIAIILVVPYLLGRFVGKTLLTSRSRWLTSLLPPPSLDAWEHFLGKGRTGYVRFRLKESQKWGAGVWATNERGEASVGSAATVNPRSIYFTRGIEVDPSTGDFKLDQDGRLVHRAGSLLVRWDEIDILEFIEG